MNEYAYCGARCCKTGTKESCHNGLDCRCHTSDAATRRRKAEDALADAKERGNQYRVTGNGGHRVAASKSDKEPTR